MSTYADRIDTLVAADTTRDGTINLAEIAIALVEATAKTIVRHGITEYNFATHRQAQLKAALTLADLLVPDSWSQETLATAWQQLTDAGYIETPTH